MNKNAIKKFAIDARNKLIASVTDKAGMLGITPDNCSEAITKGADFEVYKTAAGTEVTLNKKQCEQRRKLVDQIHARGFEAVVEDVAYTWFNRICAIRFMEVNDYMYPVRVRVLSSEKEGKNEPDVVTMAPDIDWDFTDKEREEIIDAKMNNRLDDLFRMLFIKQCNLLHEVLPGLFEETEDYTEMLLNISFTNEDDVIRMLIDDKRGIPEEDFNVSTIGEDGQPTGQVEIIGWLYQYYNTELKDDTFAKLKKNVKITKERIPAATQLFTPDWIVRYMVENSVGRIWIDHLRAIDSSVNEKETAENFGWKYYLPEAKQEESVDVKLAEIRSNYKDLKPTDIVCIDPCMGSGHILIAMFDVLMDIYTSTGYSEREAAFEIVEHNIHGLDIDQRAYQLAYFAVMMKGRGYNRRFLRGRDDVKPMPKVYAIAESNDILRSHLSLFGQSMEAKRRETAKEQMEYLLNTFKDGREYGSILNVEECDWKLLQDYVEDLDADGQITFESYGSDETQKSLRLLIKVAKNLGQKYDAVITNPPYMGASGMSAKLSKYVKDNYADSKSDLFAVFIEKCGQMAKKNGYQAMITQHAWMFLSSFEKLREKLSGLDTVNMAHLGARAFEEIGGEVVQTTSFVMRKSNILNYYGCYNRLVYENSQQKKKNAFLIGKHREVGSQKIYDNIPGKPVAYWISNKMSEVFAVASGLKNMGRVTLGMRTGDNDRFLRLWHEVNYELSYFEALSAQDARESKAKWFPYNKGGEYRKWYGNTEYVVNWQDDGYEIKENTRKVYPQLGENLGWKITSEDKYFTKGIAWSRISSSNFGVRLCESNLIFDTAAPMFFPDTRYEEWLIYIAAFMCSKIASEILRILNPTLTFQVRDVGNLPVILDSKCKDQIDASSYECFEIAKLEWDSFETSWDFRCHPLIPNIRGAWDTEEMKNGTDNLPQRLYIKACFETWQELCDNRFAQLKANEEELNRIFIDIYGLQDELTPDVEDKDVTVRKADLGRDIRSFISYAVGCVFGRYSLDKGGLMVAGQPFESVYFEATAPRAGTGVAGAPGEFYIKTEDGTKQCNYNPDRDNIIPITDEEYFSDDIVGRFVEFVETVYGKDTLEENLDFIAQALGNKGNSSREVIRNYFIKDFYKDHLKVYQKRPIYWLFDSGKQNGFKALIYMHRYDADTVGRVRTDYLHRAQNYVETAMKSAEYTIENTSVASEKSKAMKAVSKYTKQLAEMQTYDQAIAHVANQRIEINLDDGVKVNYAKFQGVEVAQDGKKTLKVDLLAKI